MRSFVLSILLVVSGLRSAAQIKTARERLPAPTSTELVSFDPPGVIIKWEPIHSDLEPVLGYKVRVWEAQGTKTYSFKTVDGKIVLTEGIEKPTLSEFKPFDGKLYEYSLTGANQSQLIVHHILMDTPYLFEILAVGASGDGNPSSRFGIQLLSNDNSTISSK